jgi:hypothetical protein
MNSPRMASGLGKKASHLLNEQHGVSHVTKRTTRCTHMDAEASKNQDAWWLRKLQMAFKTDPLSRVMPVKTCAAEALLGFWYRAERKCGLFWISC